MLFKTLTAIGLLVFYVLSVLLHAFLVSVIETNSGNEIYGQDIITGLTYFILAILFFILFLFKASFRKFVFPAYFLTTALCLIILRDMDSDHIQSERWVSIHNKTDYTYEKISPTDYRASNLLKEDLQYPFEIDTFQVKILKGLLGIEYYSDEIRVKSSANCKLSDWDSSDTLDYHLVCARELTYKRCFGKAIKHLNLAIKLDTAVSFNSLNKLAKLHSANEDYEVSLKIYSTLYLYISEEFKEFDNLPLDETTNRLLDSLFAQPLNTDSIQLKLNSENWSELFQQLNALSKKEQLEHYAACIKFCKQKLKENTEKHDGWT